MTESNTVTANSYVAYRDDWLALRAEQALDPALPIIDPHHHLYERPRPYYLLDKLLEDLRSGHNVLATVFVDSRSMYRAGGPEELRVVGETEFANGIAAIGASGIYGKERVCAGIVSAARLDHGARVRELLEAHILAGNGRFRGVRHGSAWDADPSLQSPLPGRPRGILLDARFREGFAQLAPLGLSFDAYLFHHQLNELTDLAGAFPDTAIVLDHCGTPLGVGRYAGQREAVFAAWKGSIAKLAHCENVCVKLGGLGMAILGFGFDEAALPPSSEALAAAWRPYIETCIEAFEARRCMFESNFPPDRGSCSYAVLWNAFKRIAAPCSAAEKADLFSETARRFYRLELPEPRTGEPRKRLPREGGDPV
jgi:predicted TIM-barrel fold metal-dependent hydrolase